MALQAPPFSRATNTPEPYPPVPFRQIKRATVNDAIVDQLRALIAEGTLKPGDRLPSERELCKRFGVGRTSVREALKPLITLGILEGRMGSGNVRRGGGGAVPKTAAMGPAG
jgi:DNA-binding GntR family transcriptional regulator